MPGGKQQPRPAKMLADHTESWVQPWPHEARVLEGREVCVLNQLLAWEQASHVRKEENVAKPGPLTLSIKAHLRLGLSNMHEALGNVLNKLDMVEVVHAHNPSTQEVKNGRLEM